MCSDTIAVQCQIAFGRKQLPPAQFCCAKQADSRLVPLQIHLWKFALQTGVQWPKVSAVPPCLWQSAIARCSILLCKTGWQQACANANTPMDICCYYGCAVTQQQCSAKLLLAESNWPLPSFAVQNRLTADLYHCKYTYKNFLFRQLCSGSNSVQCHTAWGRVQLPAAQCCCAKQAGSRLVPMQTNLWRLAVTTGVQ